jgi:hypothetical protein
MTTKTIDIEGVAIGTRVEIIEDGEMMR